MALRHVARDMPNLYKSMLAIHGQEEVPTQRVFIHSCRDKRGCDLDFDMRSIRPQAEFSA